MLKIRHSCPVQMLTNTKKGMGYLYFAKDQQRCVLSDRPLCRSLGKRCETLCGTPGIRVSCSMITGMRCEDFLVVRAVITYRARRQGWGTSWGVGSGGSLGKVMLLLPPHGSWAQLTYQERRGSY